MGQPHLIPRQWGDPEGTPPLAELTDRGYHAKLYREPGQDRVVLVDDAWDETGGDSTVSYGSDWLVTTHFGQTLVIGGVTQQAIESVEITVELGVHQPRVTDRGGWLIRLDRVTAPVRIQIVVLSETGEQLKRTELDFDQGLPAGASHRLQRWMRRRRLHGRRMRRGVSCY